MKTRRIAYTGQVQSGPCKFWVSGYRPTATSRFAVTRIADRPESPWMLTHIRTGMGVGSILPALSRKLTMTDKLAVLAAWETMTHLNWAVFDDLPAIGPDTNAAPVIDQVRAGPVVRAMREMAMAVLIA